MSNCAAIVDNPAIVNDDPLEGGWFFKIKVSQRHEFDSMLDEAAYTTLVGGAH